MKLCIFGVTGKTGSIITEHALKAGHTVIAPVRNPDVLKIQHNQLQAIKCDVLSEGDLSFIAQQGDIEHFIIALGTKDLWGNTVRSDGTKHIVEAINSANPCSSKVTVISAIGVAESWSQLGIINKLFAKLLLPSVMKEHALQEQAVKQSGLPYTIFRASGLGNKSEDYKYTIVESGKLQNSKISRYALAVCILDNLNNKEWLNCAKSVTGK